MGLAVTEVQPALHGQFTHTFTEQPSWTQR